MSGKKVFLRVFRVARPYRWQAIASVVALVLAQLLEVALVPLLVAGLLGAIIESGTPLGAGMQAGLWERLKAIVGVRLDTFAARVHWLLVFGALLMAVYVVRAFLLFVYLRLGQKVSQRVMHDLRGLLFARLLRLSLSFHEGRRTGELMSRTTADVSLTQNLVGLQMADAVASVTGIASGLGLMLLMSPALTLFALFVGPLTAFVITRAGTRMREITRAVQERQAELSARLQERLSSIKEVQSFVREDYEDRQFGDLNRRTLNANLRSARLGAMLYPGVELLSMTAMVVGIVLAGWLVLQHKMGSPLLLSIFIIGQRVGSYAAHIGRVNVAIQQGLAAAARVFEIVESEPHVREAPDAVSLPRVTGEVAFDRSCFAYGDGPQVLKDVSLTVRPGEVVALVGPSGAGKTSMANLIPRFYDPSEGRVLIDGRDLRHVTLASLRSQIGLVPQDTTLFSGTIEDNIRYGGLEATHEEIVAAARAANADQFIEALPGGYQTEIGERGVKLSGGQRQRISIARTILKDPRILILDEATSSLDTESESLVQEALDRLMTGRTTFIIAHRLSTVRRADRILVLSDGRIVQQGTHAELMAIPGLYRRLYERQFADSDMQAPAQANQAQPAGWSASAAEAASAAEET
jgi:subfamily B ATP-binding cassette protein MsbA